MFQKTISTLVGVVAVSALAASPALAQGDASDAAHNNPLMSPSPLPFHAARFDKIESSDFEPAIEAGIKQQLAEVKQIANNPEPPTFKNTLVALEKSGQLLAHAAGVFYMVSGANTNPTLQETQKTIAPELASLHDAIFLNPKLFERVKAIYNKRDSLDLDPESERLIEFYYNEFIHAGANLSAADSAKLKELNKKNARLMAEFSTRLLDATKAGALVIDDKAALAGLNDDQIARAADAAKARGLDGKWVIPLQNTTQQPLLQSLKDRTTRAKLFMASWTRAEQGGPNDTREIVSQLAKVRADKAKLLGFPNYAAWKLQDQMAETPDNVEDFLAKLVPAATAKARAEADDIQAMIKKTGHDFTLQPWDWNFYAEKVRKARFDLDQSKIKPYFELNRVLEDGVFYAAHLLYGLTFKERNDIPVYQDDVRVFEVIDKDGSPLGLFYADYFKRDNKGGGAWMNNLVTQSKLLGQKPVIYNVLNIPKPAPGDPALLTYDEVETMFHEFGHALHGFFADQKYPSLSGTSVARDFVEFPSQFNEHWALDPIVLKHYAVNYKTGEPIPQSLIDKIKKASTFNQGYALTELLAAAQLDMGWHMLPASAPAQQVDQFEVKALRNADLYMPHKVPPRYRSSYFQHIWGNGYSAGYYAYLWTEMLSEDAYQWFEEHGGLTRENGDRFRRMVLSRGNTEDLEQMYEDFRGREPSIQPMINARGLIIKH
ncbi:MAG TPA: peptidyl-dipeptidase Dcp [Gammaproteobacteria bacterium]|nr:peptidyl-dipeptidase Dcp [Gammaproteobacteria bacterium]